MAPTPRSTSKKAQDATSAISAHLKHSTKPKLPAQQMGAQGVKPKMLQAQKQSQKQSTAVVPAKIPSRRSQRILDRQNTSSFLFDKVPQELRDEIFELASDGLFIKTDHGDSEIGTFCGRSGDGDAWDYFNNNKSKPRGSFTALRPGLPSWMLVNKNTYATALDHLHRKATMFHMHSHDMPARVPAHVPLPSLGLVQARNVNLTKWGQCSLTTWSTDTYVVDLHEDYKPLIAMAAGHLATSTELRNLTIKFCVSIWHFDVPVLDHIVFDLPFFTMLPKNLCEVTIYLALPEPHVIATEPEFPKLANAIKEEFRTRAVALVRGDALVEEDAITVVQEIELYGTRLPRAVWRLRVTSKETQNATNYGRRVFRG